MFNQLLNRYIGSMNFQKYINKYCMPIYTLKIYVIILHFVVTKVLLYMYDIQSLRESVHGYPLCLMSMSLRMYGHPCPMGIHVDIH